MAKASVILVAKDGTNVEIDSVHSSVKSANSRLDELYSKGAIVKIVTMELNRGGKGIPLTITGMSSRIDLSTLKVDTIVSYGMYSNVIYKGFTDASKATVLLQDKYGNVKKIYAYLFEEHGRIIY
ncbi:hypothetical protein D3C81_11210 [compost metagenome]